MSRLDLTEYDISMKTGFLLENTLVAIKRKLPTEESNPPTANWFIHVLESCTFCANKHGMTRLPPYFDPWNDLASRCPELVNNKKLREEVNKLPVLDFTKLNGDREIKLAHTLLVIITNGYLWQNGRNPADVPTVLPRCLAAPLYGLFEKYDLPPGLTYADILLNNGTIKDPNGPIHVENFAPIFNPPNGNMEQWYWFFAINYMMEYEFAKAIRAIQDVLDGMDERDEMKITLALGQISEALQDMQNSAKLYHEKMSTETFPQVTAYMGGYGDPPLTDGLTFEGIKEGVKVKTPNAGQTPTMRVLDALLGIEHTKERSLYVEEIMKYLQPKHRMFIKALRNRPQQLKSTVEASSNTELKQEYQHVVQAVTNFRSYHIQLVAKFFVQAIRKTQPPHVQEELKPVTDFTMQFLKGMRDDTKQISCDKATRQNRSVENQ